MRWRYAVLLPILFFLTACSTVQLKPEAETVHLHFQEKPDSPCEFIGDVVGTHGNILTFLFISNEDLIKSAINDIKNEAHRSGADSVYLREQQLLFSSSVTLWGQMYRCDSDEYEK